MLFAKLSELYVLPSFKLWFALVSANELSETSTIYEVLRGDFYIISQAIYAFG